MPQPSAAPFHQPTARSEASIVDEHDIKERAHSHRGITGEEDMAKTPRGWWVFPAVLLGLAFWGYIIYVLFIA
ncbi:hypothetical protein GFB49_00375 [Epibacterium sp. SM1979]|uniref:Uncharacterized protein n=1 Tax=Tritonibacter litoralis TaxID=2662264 RepID=A0A843YCW7_9RHOB|nr:hypothetical protein [Tritonibacter litoralis]MQQ06899.1 hypothetical protein [Tritonibacter litoralis]